MMLSLLGDTADIVLNYFLPFVLVISVLVVVHEWGHYWVARRCGVRVEAFSIGMGPELLGWQDRSGTRWRVALLPLGGYVRMSGDEDASSTAPDQERLAQMSDEERRGTFHAQPLGARVAIIAAGPAANFIFAILVFAGLAWVGGEQIRPPVIDEVVPGSAAEQAGIRAGDRIVTLDGSAVGSFREIQNHFRIHLDRPTVLGIDRSGEQLALTVQAVARTRTTENGEETLGVLGVVSRQEPELRRYSPTGALWLGVTRSYEIGGLMLTALGQVVTGRRSIDELGGPVRIAQVSGQASRAGWLSMLTLMAMLSVSLGLINLLPIPVLDGGHLLFFAIEAVGGRALSERLHGFAFHIGIALIAGLMLWLTVNDLSLVIG